MTGQAAGDDERLLQLLADYWAASDPVPEEVAEFAAAVWSLPRIETFFASVVFDSLDEQPVSVRATADVRALTFSGDGYQVEAEHDLAEGVVTGRVEPVDRYRVEGRSRAEAVTAMTDEQGRFILEPVGRGPFRLVVSPEDGEPLLTTEWVLLT